MQISHNTVTVLILRMWCNLLDKRRLCLMFYSSLRTHVPNTMCWEIRWTKGQRYDFCCLFDWSDWRQNYDNSVRLWVARTSTVPCNWKLDFKVVSPRMNRRTLKLVHCFDMWSFWINLRNNLQIPSCAILTRHLPYCAGSFEINPFEFPSSMHHSFTTYSESRLLSPEHNQGICF